MIRSARNRRGVTLDANDSVSVKKVANPVKNRGNISRSGNKCANIAHLDLVIPVSEIYKMTSGKYKMKYKIKVD